MSEKPPREAPEYDASGLPKNEGEEAYDVRDAWPSGQYAPGAQPPTQPETEE